MSSLRQLDGDALLRFGPYAFHLRQRLVLDGERPLRMGGRALDILQVLLEHAGSVVSKDELIARVWPTSVVEEGRWTGRAALYRQRPATRLQLYRFGPA